jgi:protein-S-isoprenylcysteine O-methyltransferase Ste14
VPERSVTLGRLRLLALFLFVAALIAVSRPTRGLLVAGAILAAAGELIRMWAAGHLRKSVRLAVSGPYAHTQNPLYLGRLLILTGLGVAAKSPYGLNWIALAIGYGIFFFYYIPRKLRVEGGRLERIHGEAYATYRASVPILFPSLRTYPGGEDRWSFAQMVRNQEPLVLLGLAAAFAWLASRVIAG